MQTFLVFLTVSVVSFGLGVGFSQRAKDWVRGVPAEVRDALNTVEARALSKMRGWQNVVVADVRSMVPGSTGPAA